MGCIILKFRAITDLHIVAPRNRLFSLLQEFRIYRDGTCSSGSGSGSDLSGGGGGGRSSSSSSSTISVRNRLTLRLLMSYMYGAPTLDVSRSHTTTQHSR